MEKISKAATQPERFREPAMFYRSAREGFQDFLEARLSAGHGVLLPAFIGWSPREGSGVFDPVSATGAPFGFYELNPDLTVNLEKLEEALGSGRWGVLVLIHYWGRAELQLERIRAMADRAGAVLVEDLAHGFYSTARGGPAGRVGSVNLYSLHKMFPTPEGGMIQYRDPSLITTQRETMPELARLAMDYDIHTIGEARRNNFLQISERLRSLPELGQSFDLLWPDLSATDVPQSLPIRVHTGNRNRIYEAMNADGYGMTSLYHTLLDQLQEEFPAMTDLSRAITNFPVHQDVDDSMIDGMIDSFRSALAS